MEKYSKICEYLDSFINYERKNFFPYKKSLKLKRVRKLLDSLNIQYNKLNVIHIAGTKGKGSTATFCAYILASSGFKVGLYTSPHFFDFRERIAILDKKNGNIRKTLISKEDVTRIVTEFKPTIERLRFTEEFGKLTFFEVYTAIAFRYFIEQKLDFVVLEVGLGGKLDATNVIKKPLICVITRIGYDHTDKLGKTLQEIASQKAGIIKKECLVVSASQEKEAERVLKQKCKKEKANLFLYNKDFFAENIRLCKTFSLFDFRFDRFSIKNIKVKLLGLHQIQNASISIATIYLLEKKGIIKSKVNYRKGVFSATIDGRFEIAKIDPLIVLDVAHNPPSFEILSKNLKLYFKDKKIILIFAASKDKDIKNMLNKIKNVDKYIFTSFSNPRSFLPEEICKILNITDAILTKNIKEALKIALKFYKKDNLILISGSLFLVSEAKSYIKRCKFLN